MSLKQRLVLLFLGATVLVWLPVNLYFYQRAVQEVDEIYDAHLAQSARVLMAMAAAAAERGDLARLGELLPAVAPRYLPQARAISRLNRSDPGVYERWIAFQLLQRDGSFRLISADAPHVPLADSVAGFSDNVIDGTRWRVFGLADPKHALVLYAGEHHTMREELARHLAENLLFPRLVVVPLMLTLIWFAVDKGLAPLTQLAGDVKQRNAQDLGALTIDPVPEEVKPLVAALNIMFKRVERGLENERQFTGNAAHEFRTPLAGLRVQAQVARNSTNDVQRLT